MYILKKTHIKTSPEQLWDLLTETEKMKRWNPTIISEEPLSSGEPGVGFKSIVRIKEGSSINEYENEISSYDPVNHLGIMLRGGNLGQGPMNVDYHLIELTDGTELTYESRWEPYGIMLKLMSPLITMMARRNVEDVMGRLKKLAEGKPVVD